MFLLLSQEEFRGTFQQASQHLLTLAAQAGFSVADLREELDRHIPSGDFLVRIYREKIEENRL
jgi:hypothetical protein